LIETQTLVELACEASSRDDLARNVRSGVRQEPV
jgi:hypothetical protein